jgi:hypothetical protein
MPRLALPLFNQCGERCLTRLRTFLVQEEMQVGIGKDEVLEFRQAKGDPEITWAGFLQDQSIQ